MNIKKFTSSIRFKAFFYFITFSASLLLLLWLIEGIYFRYSYEQYKIKNINQIADSILGLNITSLNQNLENIAYQNEVCMEVWWNNGSISNYNTMLVGCGLGKNNATLNQIEKSFINSDKDKETLRLENDEYKTQGYLYGLKTNIGTVFLYSALEDLSEANVLLKKQFIYITIVACLFALLISYYLSIKLTKPIKEITNKAKQLGKKDKVNFELVGIDELDDLSKVLNEAKNDMEKTENLRRDLLANVSHDLKTPLTMIRAYAEMVRDISYKDEEKRLLHCNIIMNETDRLNRLVNDILSLSKLEADADKIKKEKFDLVKEIKEIIKRYEIIKETEEYHFKLEMPNKAIVYADKNKLNQVIYNLVNNAINYTGKDKVVKIRVTKEKDAYLVEVIDTGKGISKKELSIIWDKYYKNDKNHQRNIVGTGIGLSIVKTILESHGFSYGVKSTIDVGSNFYFYVKKQ